MNVTWCRVMALLVAMANGEQYGPAEYRASATTPSGVSAATAQQPPLTQPQQQQQQDLLTANSQYTQTWANHQRLKKDDFEERNKWWSQQQPQNNDAETTQEVWPYCHSRNANKHRCCARHDGEIMCSMREQDGSNKDSSVSDQQYQSSNAMMRFAPHPMALQSQMYPHSSLPYSHSMSMLSGGFPPLFGQRMSFGYPPRLPAGMHPGMYGKPFGTPAGMYRQPFGTPAGMHGKPFGMQQLPFHMAR